MQQCRGDSTSVRGKRAALAGSAALCLVEGLLHLDEHRAVLDAMVEGWVTQMTSRGLKATTIASGRWQVRRFAEFTNEYPWQWSPADLEEFRRRFGHGPSRWRNRRSGATRTSWARSCRS